MITFIKYEFNLLKIVILLFLNPVASRLKWNVFLSVLCNVLMINDYAIEYRIFVPKTNAKQDIKYFHNSDLFFFSK